MAFIGGLMGAIGFCGRYIFEWALPGWRMIVYTAAAGFVLGIIVQIYFLLDLLNPSSPYWVKIGDRFSYRNILGVHVLDWADVKTINFEHEEICDLEESIPVRTGYHSTFLVVRLATGRRLRTRIGSFYTAAEYAARIVQTLVQGLRDHDARTRRFAAEGLGRLGPDGVRHLRNAAQHKHECIRKDATEALHHIEEAVRPLQEATRDQDEAVRKAATDALGRIQSGIPTPAGTRAGVPGIGIQSSHH
jgi:hypothetical protein